MQTETELINIGTGFLETRKYQKSIEVFTQVIELNPANTEAFELRGIANFKLLAIENALADTSRAIEIDKENHNAWFNKGQILSFQHKYEEAEYCYLQADKIYPDSFNYLTGIIETTIAQRKYNETISFCKQVLSESPADVVALLNRGIAYSHISDYKAAIKDYLKLIDIGKRNATIYNNLGFWYSKLGELKKASNNLSVALQFNPNHAYALDNMGFVEYSNNNNDKALKYIDRSLEIDPSNSYAYKNRALVLLQLGKRDLAFSDLQKAKSLGYAEDHDTEVDELLKNM